MGNYEYDNINKGLEDNVDDNIVKIDKDKLVSIIEFAYLMSRHISSIDIYGFDGAMCDFYDGLTCKISNSKNIEQVELNDFDLSVLERIEYILKY